MNQGIVICTWGGWTEPVLNLLSSLEKSDWPLYIVVNDYMLASPEHLHELAKAGIVIPLGPDGFECGAIQAILNHTTLEEFFFLQDTTEILNPLLFTMAFSYDGSVILEKNFHSLLGKLRRSILEKIKIPIVRTKEESINAEASLATAYIEAECQLKRLFDDFGDEEAMKANRYENRFGRKNLVIENDYLRKYKGTWTMSNGKRSTE